MTDLRDTSVFDPSALGARVAHALAGGTLLDAVPAGQLPPDAAAAYAVQGEVIARAGGAIGGWKVGAKSPAGAIQCAPLPQRGVQASGARFAHGAFTPLGLELEIAFRLGREFAARGTPYEEAEVLESIVAMAATIEIVSSRYAAWPELEPLAQLADLQNHGALVVGEFRPYDAHYPFLAPALQLSFDAREVAPPEPANPAGDPRRLLTWLVNHSLSVGLPLTPDTVLTAGSYTGLFLAPGPGTVTGHIEGFAAVSLTLD